jgi:hypothetical protein
VWVGDNNIGQLLYITQAMRKSVMVLLADRSSHSPVIRGHTEWAVPSARSSPS